MLRFNDTVLPIILLFSSIFVSQAIAEEVNLYSARKENLIKPLLDKFTTQTNIKVNLVTGKADALLKRLESEGHNSPADILLTVDAGRLHRAIVSGVIQPLRSEVLEGAVPESYRDPKGYWYGLSKRARLIMYIKGNVTPSELSTYEVLAESEWKGRTCIRSSNNICNQSLVAAMIASDGERKTENWAKKSVQSLARRHSEGDRDQIKAAAAGLCDIAIANTYYLGNMIRGKDKAQQEAAAKVTVFWPNQNGRGTHVNISGAAITISSKNKANALKLLEFLVSDESQQWYAEVNDEYRVKPGIEWSETLQFWGTFKADSLNMTKLGEYNAAAVKLMDRAGWK